MLQKRQVKTKKEKPAKKPDKQSDLEYPLDFEKVMKGILKVAPEKKGRQKKSSD